MKSLRSIDAVISTVFAEINYIICVSVAQIDCVITTDFSAGDQCSF